MRKQSLVCSLTTAIEVYRPNYAVLENVCQIATPRKNDGAHVNTYATMICAVVDLGYQVESFLCDAWLHGNCQSRTLLIIAITKPGLVPLKLPYRSHHHGNGGYMAGQLYRAPNRQSFGNRKASGPVHSHSLMFSKAGGTFQILEMATSGFQFAILTTLWPLLTAPLVQW